MTLDLDIVRVMIQFVSKFFFFSFLNKRRQLGENRFCSVENEVSNPDNRNPDLINRPCVKFKETGTFLKAPGLLSNQSLEIVAE